MSTAPIRPTPVPIEIPLAHRGDARNRRASVLLYGVPKSGKTHNALTFPVPLVLAFGANTGTVDVSEYPYMTPASWGGTWQGFRSRILPVLKAREAHLLLGPGASPDDVQTIVIDEVNTMAKLLEEAITAGDPGRKWAHSDFGRLGGELTSTLRDLTQLKNPAGPKPRYNVIACCHIREANDPDGNLVAVQPMIMGQTRDVLGSYFDTVLLLANEITKSIDPTTKLVVQQQQFVAYSTPPDKFHARLGLGGSIGKDFPVKIVLTEKTALRDTILRYLGTLPTNTNK